MKNLLFLSAFLILLFSSCFDNIEDCTVLSGQDKLPAATQEGKHTFGAMVNGKPWVAHVTAPDLVSAALSPQAIPDPQLTFHSSLGLSSLSLSINRFLFNKCDTIKQILRIYILNPQVDKISKISYDDSAYGDQRNKKNWYYLDTFNNSCTITKIDTVYQKNHNPVISGIFNFRVINEKFKDTIVFSNGRFDIRPNIIRVK